MSVCSGQAIRFYVHEDGLCHSFLDADKVYVHEQQLMASQTRAMVSHNTMDHILLIFPLYLQRYPRDLYQE